MIAENVRNIRQRIASACQRVGRSPEEITLIAVTKTFSTEHIREAVSAGLYDIGENYVQELRRKREHLRDEPIRWHLVGHLQSNKIKYIADWIHLIHALDSLHLGQELSTWGARTGRTINVLVEVNTTGEASKFGVSVDATPDLLRQLLQLPNLNVQGLMTIGPFLPDPEESRPAFRSMRELRDSFQSKGSHIPHLSMGMTNDFEVAIEEGATMVRIGTAIFGTRKKVALAA